MQPKRQIGQVESRYRRKWHTIEDVINDYLRWVSWTLGAQSMDFESAHVQGTSEPVSFPPNMEGVRHMDRIFNAVRSRMAGPYWDAWVASRINNVEKTVIAARLNVKNRWMPKTKEHINDRHVANMVDLVDEDLKGELARWGMWDYRVDLARQEEDLYVHD